MLEAGSNSMSELFSSFAGGTPADAGGGTIATDSSSSTASSSGGDLVSSVQANLEQSLAINSALQQLYLAYSTFTEALRIISEAVQKGIDISENERQDISQGQE